MSAKDRRAAFAKAVAEGKAARLAGKSRDENPYRKTLWGNGGAWELGWLEADAESQAINKSAAVPSPGHQ